MSGKKRHIPHTLDGQPVYDNMPIHYRTEQSVLARNLLDLLNAGRLLLDPTHSESDARKALTTWVQTTVPQTQRPVAQWVDQALTTDARSKLMGLLRQKQFRSQQGVTQVALRQEEYRELKVLRAQRAAQARGDLSAYRLPDEVLSFFARIDPTLAIPSLHACTQSAPQIGAHARAGSTVPADDFIEREVDLNEYAGVSSAHTLFIDVSGDSMLDVQIGDGDLAIIDRKLTPQHGDLVAAWLEDGYLIKQLSLTREGASLLSRNAEKNYAPIALTGENSYLIGVITGTIKRFSRGRR